MNTLEEITKATPAAVAKHYGVSYPAALKLQKELKRHTKNTMRKDLTQILQAQDFEANQASRRHRVTIDRLAEINAGQIDQKSDLQRLAQSLNSSVTNLYLITAAIGVTTSLTLGILIAAVLK